CEPCKDNVESVLREKLPFEALRPAEKPMLDDRLRMCDTLIQSHARELTQLQQTLRDGKDDSVLLSQHLKDLLTHNDLDSHQGQGFQKSLFEGHWLAECLACKLSPDEGNEALSIERLPLITYKIYLEEPGWHFVRPEKDNLNVCPISGRRCPEEDLPSDPLHLIFCYPFPTCHSMEVQEVEKKELPEESKDERPYSDDKFAFDEPEVSLGLDGACGCSHAKEDETPTNLPDQGENFPYGSRSIPWAMNVSGDYRRPQGDCTFAFCNHSSCLSSKATRMAWKNQNDHDDLRGPKAITLRENGVPRDSLDDYYLTYSVLPNLSDSFWPYRSTAIFSLEDVGADLEEDTNEIHQDSLEECYLAISVDHNLSGSCRPLRSASYHLILYRPLLFLSSIFASIRVFSNESVLCIRWPKYWSFSISSSKEYSGLISFRIDWFDLCSPRDSQESSPAPQFKSINYEPKSNSQQKSTPDARIRHQQVGAEWRGAGGIAWGRVRA
ncbi:hypothetical protein FD754_009309, partial [Muntiacus muntjak]